MTTVATPSTARISTGPRRERKSLEAKHPDVQLVGYNRGLGLGLVVIDTVTYAVIAQRNEGKLTGLRLLRDPDHGGPAVYDVDVTGEPWRCDCPDATYRPDRPGGCKHVVALKQAAGAIRAPACTPTA